MIMLYENLSYQQTNNVHVFMTNDGMIDVRCHLLTEFDRTKIDPCGSNLSKANSYLIPA